MPAIKRTDLIAINVRLPKGLHKSLKQQAKRSGVPLNTEIIQRLEDTLGTDDDLKSQLARLEEEIKETRKAVEKNWKPLADLGLPRKEETGIDPNAPAAPMKSDAA